MRDPKHRAGLPAEEAQFLQMVEESDWVVNKVAPRPGLEGDTSAYTTGLYYRYRHPEIILFGLAPDTMQGVLDGIGAQVKAGKIFEPSKSYNNVFDNCPCEFRNVEKVYFDQRLGRSTWFYQSYKYPALQCFWPDSSGRFPWDYGCDADVRNAQPELFRAVAGAPAP